MRTLSWRTGSVLAASLLLAVGCSRSGSSSDPSPPGVNHAVHLQSTAFGSPMGCETCHAATGFTVDFSQNAPLQAAGARFDPSTQTCSNVSCHGSFKLGAISGTFAAPRWSDTATASCTSCHGMPPAGHPTLATTSTAANCAGCHADTVNADGTIDVASGAHMNGKADVTGGVCTSCHGDGQRPPSMPGVDPFMNSAPPLSPAGAPAYADGAHLVHLNPNPAVAASVPTLCNECHIVPGDAAHATSPPAQRVVFGGRAIANGARPTFDPVAGGCAASYCHGNFNFNGITGSSTTMLWASTTRITCGDCHAMPPAGNHPPVSSGTPASCNRCHPTTVDPQGVVIPGGAHMNTRADIASLGCTKCHGDEARVGILAGTDVNLVSAPPVATTGAPASVTGAHLGHVNPAAATALSAPVACAECHVVPGDFAHSTSNTPRDQRVAFGPLSRTGGAAPTYASASGGCAASYCHGNFSFNGVAGSKATVNWTDTTALTCTSCHGMPPTGHPALLAPVTAVTCARCHPRTVNADGSINMVDRGHMNGLPDTSAVGCTTCHGDSARVANLPGTDGNLLSAPPVAPTAAPAYAVGAHLGHVNPTAASFLMPPIACAECHPVPADSAHATRPPVPNVAFGAFSRTGGAGPTWSAASAGCAASYCHGNFAFGAVKGASATPVWTDSAAMTCTSCHGMPPTGHLALTAPVTAASCAPCHPAAVNTDGTINRTGGGHMNGRSDVNTLACTTCHGDATRKANLAGTDANLTSSPPVANAGAPAYAVGAHMGHLNPTAASYLMAPIACSECHPVPTDQAHATSPPAQKMVFGTLSRTGGAAPTFNATTSGCSATWCHGRFTLGSVTGANAAPLWTDTWPAGEARCVSCHGMPPTGHPTYAGSITAASCFQCHPQSVNSDGTIKQGGGHINGKADGGGCTSCHADPPSTGHHGTHANYACGSCHPTGYTSSATVAAYHQNGVVDLGTQAGYLCGGKSSLVGCKPYKSTPPGYGTCTINCHEQHNNRQW